MHFNRGSFVALKLRLTTKDCGGGNRLTVTLNLKDDWRLIGELS